MNQLAVKRSIYSRITGDPTLMNLLDNTGPFPGRLPEDSPPLNSRTVGAISYNGDTSLSRGSKEEHTITLDIWTYSHDLAEQIAVQLDRLFRPSPGRQWFPLVTTGGQAFVRGEFATDVPDPGSELFHKVYRLRIKFGWSAAA